MKNLFKIIFLLSITFSFSNNLIGQEKSKDVKKEKISKAEKKQRKADLKSLNERIIDFSQADVGRSTFIGNYSTLKFVKKSNDYENFISLNKSYDLFRYIKFSSVCKQKKKIYGFRQYAYSGFECHELINIFDFQYKKLDENGIFVLDVFDYLLFEYKAKHDDINLSHKIISKAEFLEYEKKFNKDIEVLNLLKKEEFTGLLAIDTVYYDVQLELENKTYSRISTRSKFLLNIYSQNNFNNDNPNLKADFVNTFKSFPNNVKYLGDIITFSLDSIKLYKFNEDKFYRYIFSDEQSKEFMSQKFGYEKERVLTSHVSDLSFSELKKMSKKEYWDSFLPKDEDFILEFLDEQYISPSYQIGSNERFNVYDFHDHFENDVFSFSTTVFNSDIDVMYDDPSNNKTLFKYFNNNPKLIREMCLEAIWLSCLDKLERIQKDKSASAKKEKFQKDLISKYGKKYVDEAQNGNIVVGMPEGLLQIPLRVWNIKSNTQWEKGYRIFCSFKFDTSKKLIVYVYDGKVASISNW